MKSAADDAEMFFMNKLVSLVILLISSICFSESAPNEKWFQCSNDSDCTEIRYSCAGAVVNKEFRTEATEYYQLENARSECFERKPTEAEKKIPYKVFCKAKKCGTQGVYPHKPGFS